MNNLKNSNQKRTPHNKAQIPPKQSLRRNNVAKPNRTQKFSTDLTSPHNLNILRKEQIVLSPNVKPRQRTASQFTSAVGKHNQITTIKIAKRTNMEVTTMSSSMGFKSKLGKKNANTMNSTNIHLGGLQEGSSPVGDGAQARLRRKMVENQQQQDQQQRLSQDQQRSSVGAGYSQHSQQAQFSAVHMTSATAKPNSYSKIVRNDESRNSLTSGVQSRTFGGTFGAAKDLSPKPERNSMGHPGALTTQQQASHGRYLAANDYPGFNQNAQGSVVSSGGGGRISGQSVPHPTSKRALVAKKFVGRRDGGGSGSGRKTAQLQPRNGRRGAGQKQSHYDLMDAPHMLAKNTDQATLEYLRHQQTLYQMNPTISRGNSVKSGQASIGHNLAEARSQIREMNNVKSIGLFDLRKHLKKNAKRVLSSKYRQEHSNIFAPPILPGEGGLAGNNPDHYVLAPLQTNHTASLNPSNSGHIDNMPRNSLTLSSNKFAATEGTTLTGMGQGANTQMKSLKSGLGGRTATTGMQSSSLLHSLEDDYTRTVQRNTNLSGNSQFDKFLQEKFMAQEAARRKKIELPKKSKFVLRGNANNQYQQPQRQYNKVSLSPKQSMIYQDRRSGFDQQEQQRQADLSKQSPPKFQSGTKAYTKTQQINVKRRQIDTQQMLSNLKSSLGVNDSTAGDHRTNSNLDLGVADSRIQDSRLDMMNDMNLSVTLPDRNFKGRAQFDIASSLQSEPIDNQVGKATDHGSQERQNPLLLDDKLMQHVQPQPQKEEEAFDFQYESKQREKHDYMNKQMHRLSQNFNADYHVLGQEGGAQFPLAPGPDKAVVLALEPRALHDKKLKQKQSQISQSIKLGPKRPPGFADYLKVEELQRYRSQVEMERKSSENDNDKTDADSRILIQQQEMYRNQMLARPQSALRSKHSSTLKTKEALKHAGQAAITDQHYLYGSVPSISDNLAKRKSNRMPSASSSGMPKTRIKEQTAVSMKKRLKNKPTASAEKYYGPHEAEQMARLNQISSDGADGQQYGVYMPILKDQVKFKNYPKGKMARLLAPDHLSKFEAPSINKNRRTAMSTVKSSNQQAPAGRQSKRKAPSQVNASKFTKPRDQRNPQIVSNLLGNRIRTSDSPGQHRQVLSKVPVSVTNLHHEMKKQPLAPKIIHKIHQNSAGFLNNELNLIPSISKTGSNAKLVKKESRPDRFPAYASNSRTNPSLRSPSRSVERVKKRKLTNILHESESHLQFIRNESGLTLDQKTYDDKQNILDIRINNASTPTRQEPTNVFENEHSLPHSNKVAQRAMSSNDYGSPARDNHLSIERESSIEHQGSQVRSNSHGKNDKGKRSLKQMSVQRAQRLLEKHTNSRSEAQIVSQSVARSQISQCERSQQDLMSELHATAQSQKQPMSQFRSQLQARTAHKQPSLRNYMPKPRRPAGSKPGRAQSEHRAFEHEVKQSAGTYSHYAKALYQNIGLNSRKRASSARPIDIRGLKYKFQVVDLAKYTDSLKYGVFNWPVRYCTLGRKIPNPVERNETLVKEIHFDTLLRILKETDWKRTPVWEQFERHGRWISEDEKIYSEIELKYLSSTLSSMENQANQEEFDQNEGLAIIKKHWGKTVYTMQKLMSTMNMMYYYEKLKMQIQKLEAPGKRPGIVHLEKLMSRCLKLYEQIDSFMKIFKLIQIKELRQEQTRLRRGEVSEKDAKKEKVLIKRLIVAICLLLKENPVLPLQFNFGGECLLERLKKEKDSLKERQQQEREQERQYEREQIATPPEPRQLIEI